MGPFAREFREILPTLAANGVLRGKVLALIAIEPVLHPLTQGCDRLHRFRRILSDLVEGRIGIEDTVARAARELPPPGFPHVGSGWVVTDGWHEGLIHTQLSRFYNQAVLEMLLILGHTDGFVPHSAAESPDSPCSEQLAGREHALRTLHGRLVATYRDGGAVREAKIPEHPGCTHVVTPAGAPPGMEQYPR